MRNLRSLAAAGFLLSIAAPCAASESPSPPPMTESFQLAITPAWAHSLSAEGLGAGVDVFPGRKRRVGVSLVGALYQPFSREQTARTSTGPTSETAGWAGPEVRAIPLRTSFFELHLLGGVGIVETRPLSVIDPAHRHFDFGSRVAFSPGVAIRIAMTRRVALSLELRDVIFVEPSENERVDAAHPDDAATWLGDKQIRNLLELRLGLTFKLFSEPS